MNRKLGRLLRPGMGIYFFVMAAFCVAALLEGQYWLAAAETSVTLLVFMLYIMNRNRRDRQIQQYIQTAANTMEANSQGESPLPAVLVRLGDGGIVWTNSKFDAINAQLCSQAVINAQVTANLSCLQNTVATLSGMTKTVIPIANVCPEPMQRYNSWTAPTATAPTT